jgi:predicted nucleotidyltransferase
MIENIIFEVVSGSTVYGLNDANSDIDSKGIYVVSFDRMMDIFKGGIVSPVTDKKKDRQIFELRHFLSLLLKGNPHALEMLWTPEQHIIHKNEIMDTLIERRVEFLSKSLKDVYINYAKDQVKRLENHKHRLDTIKEPDKPDIIKYLIFERLDGLQVKASHEMLDKFIFTKSTSQFFKMWKAPEHKFVGGLLFDWDRTQKFHFFDLSLKAIQENELKFQGFIRFKQEAYKKACQDYEEYQEWHRNRNKRRAEMEKAYGMDCKHAMHSMRLLNMAAEILTTKQLTLARTVDKDMLLDIKYGRVPYEEFKKMLESKIAEVEQFAKQSTLPNKVNSQMIQEIYRTIIEKMWGASWLP